MDTSQVPLNNEEVDSGSRSSPWGSTSANTRSLEDSRSPPFTAIAGNLPIPSTPQALLSRARFYANTPLFQTSSRSMHASNVERLALLKVMTEHLPALETRDTDSRTAHKRASVWSEITEKFNAGTAVKRNRHQVQTLYKNMKAKAKKYQLRYLDPTTTVYERDHVSEMLLGMLNEEYQHRRNVMQQAALMALKEDSSSADFKDHNISRDVSQFLKQEMHEASDVNSSAVLSPQASGCSPNSTTRDSNSSNGKGVTTLSENSNPTLNREVQKFNLVVKNEEGANTLTGELKAENPPSDEPTQCMDKSPERPESVRQQELWYAQQVTECKNIRPELELSRRPSLEPEANKNSASEQYPAFKKRKIGLDDQSMCRTFTEIEEENSDARTSDKAELSKRKLELAPNYLQSGFCCSSLHDEVLKMKRLEHQVKMQILDKKLEAECQKQKEERDMRKIEHEIRVNLLKNRCSIDVGAIACDKLSAEQISNNEENYKSVEK